MKNGKVRLNEGTRTPKKADLTSEYCNKDSIILKDQFILLSKRMNANNRKDKELFNKWIIDNKAYDKEVMKKEPNRNESNEKTNFKTIGYNNTNSQLVSYMNEELVIIDDENDIMKNDNNFNTNTNNNNIVGNSGKNINNNSCFNSNTNKFSSLIFDVKKRKEMVNEIDPKNTKTTVQIIKLKKKL